MEQKTIALMNVLDAQLTVLSIEGLRSEHQIYEYDEPEIEYNTITCPMCGGSGFVWIEEWGTELNCHECSGGGEVEIEVEKIVRCKESWTESNIFI